MAGELGLTIEFRCEINKSWMSQELTGSSGGLEMLFDNETKHKVTIPSKNTDESPSTIASLIRYLCDHVMRDSRKELFVLDGSM